MPLGQRWLTWFAGVTTIDSAVLTNWVQANNVAPSGSAESAQTFTITTFKNPTKKQDVFLYYQGEQLLTTGVYAPQGHFLPSSAWLVQEFEKQIMVGESRLLSGEKVNAEVGAVAVTDNLVCACFSTTSKTIKKALQQAGTDLPELIATFGCGSKCGSCLPELKRLRQSIDQTL